MRPSRRAVAGLAGVVLGLAGCDSAPAQVTRSGTHEAPILPHDLATAVLGIGLAILSVLLVSVVRQAVAHRRQASRIAADARPAVIGGRDVYLVPGRSVALVAGMRHPRTFVSRDVVAELDPDELRAVVDHERHHELTRAPLQLVILGGIGSPLAFLPAVARRLEAYRARLEIEADASAIARGATRASVARAILKLGGGAGTADSAAPFAAAASIRLHILLGDPPPRERRWPGDVVVAAGALVFAVVVCSFLR